MLWLHRFTKLVVFSTFLLIIAGGLVTSTNSGLAVPDWPLSYGQLLPPMIGGIRFEHTHRVIAGAVLILTLILMIWLLRREKRKWVRWLGVAAFLAVIAQALLGGMTVLFLLPAPVSIFHACLAQTFFCLTVILAQVTSPSFTPLPYPPPQGGRVGVGVDKNLSSLRRLLIITTCFIYFQLITGAALRHTSGRLALILHLAGAFLVILHALLVTKKISIHFGAQKELLHPAVFLGILVIVQIFLGLGALTFTQILGPSTLPRTSEVFFTTAHQASGALILATSLALTVLSFKKDSDAAVS